VGGPGPTPRLGRSAGRSGRDEGAAGSVAALAALGVRDGPGAYVSGLTVTATRRAHAGDRLVPSSIVHSTGPRRRVGAADVRHDGHVSQDPAHGDSTQPRRRYNQRALPDWCCAGPAGVWAVWE
jgi:hypothetical protein